MRLLSKITLGTATAALLLAGCMGGGTSSASTQTVKPVIPEEKLGLRKTALADEIDTKPAATQYPQEGPGGSKKIVRAYQDAPPMIPHSVEGLIPITKGNNACLGCHMPENAQYMDPKPTPIPSTHFLDMRPHHKWDGKKFTKVVDNYKNETSVKKINHLSNARFNCTQCHAPQSKTELAVQNTFQPDYKKPDAKFKSSWNEVILDDLNTVGDQSYVTPDDVANNNSPAGESAWKGQH